MEQPPKNYMSLEVFQNYGLFRRKQRTVPCEDILCHQRQDLVNKLFQLLGHSKCTELLQLDEFLLCNILLGNDTEAEYPVNILSVSGAFLLNYRL